MIFDGNALLISLLIALSFTLTEGGKCDAANSFQCPMKCDYGSLESTLSVVYDCLECDGYFNTDQSQKICFDRKLFAKSANNGDPLNHYPFLWNDLVGVIVWFVTAGVATACGVGGGGIYVPLGIILLRFSSKPASGLSQASIFGASLGGLLLNIRDKHPDTKIRDTIGKRDAKGKLIPYENEKTKAQIEEDEKNYLSGAPGRQFYTRPLIDYDMALFLSPLVMAGAVLGVMIQKVMPNWLFLSLAAVILGMTSQKTFKKFFAAYKIDKENREKRNAMEAEQPNINNHIDRGDDGNIVAAAGSLQNDVEVAEMLSPDQQRIEKNINGNDREGNGGDVEDDISFEEENSDFEDQDSTTSFNTAPLQEINDRDDIKKLKRRQELLAEDSRQYPMEKVLYLLLLWVGLALITFFKGGKGVPSIVGITCEDAMFYVLIALQFLWTIGFATVFGLRAVSRTECRLAVKYPFHKNDVLWNRRKLNSYASFSFGSGIVAGLVGIGGGMVLGPLMLQMDVHPRVSSATTATMTILTSSIVAIIFVTSGLVPWEYALFFFCICFSGAYIGKRYIDSYVKKTGMASVLIGILATIIGLATMGCFIIVILNLNSNNWCFDGFKAFCDENKGKAGCQVARLMNTVEDTFQSYVTGL